MAYPVNDNSNLAYDLSRFDVADIENRRMEREKENRLKIRMAPAFSISKSGSKFKVVMAAFMTFAALFAVNYFNTKKDDVARMVEEQQAILDSVRDDNELLQSKLDAKANISYIEQYAREKLGMTKVGASQKKYITVNTANLVEVGEDGSSGFLGAVQDWFGSFLEYIGF